MRESCDFRTNPKNFFILSQESDMAELSVVSGNLYDCKPLFVPSAGCLLVATGSAITAVSAETGEKLGQLLGHKASVTCLALVPADSRLATHFQSNTSTISTGTSTGTAASMSGSRAVVVSGSLDGEAIVWDSVRLHRLSGESAIQFKTSIFDLLPIRAGAMLARKQTGRFCVDLLAVVEKIFHPGKREVETVASSEEKESGKPAEGFRANRRLYAAVGFDCTNGTTGTKVNTLYTPRQGICLLAGDGETSDLLISASVCKLSIQSGKEPSKQLKFLAATDSRITSLCCGSSESAPQGVVVAGHESGEITVYHDIRAYFQRSHIVVDSTSKRPLVSSPAATTCHWHAHPVAALTLATDCTHIFSGGEEGVLVMWPVNTNVATSVSSSNRSFLPRLGAPISQLSAMVDIDSDEELDQNGFSSNGTRVVVTTIDNCVRVVNAASMSVVWVLRLLAISCRSHTIASLLYRNSRGSRAQGTSSKTPTTVDSTKSTALTTNLLSPALAQYVQSDNNWRCCISLEPRTGYLVCNGYPGQLQAFDLSAQAFVTSYTVTDYTRVSRAEYYSQIYAPSLTLFEIITIAGIGHFMVTVDARRGEELDPESSLKFWQWNESKNCYRVSAQVDNPHGSGVRLSGIAVSPVFYKTIVEDSIRGAHQASYVLCVTTAVNGTIKFWQGIQQLVNEAYNGDVLPLRWTCLFSFCYRECPTRGVTFSKDGSLLALAFQSSVSLWQPLSTGPALKATLTCQHSSPIQFARFIEPESGR